MGILKSVKTNITYKVPSWNFCNCMSQRKLGQPDGTMCRFCIKEGKKYRCALYNMPLAVEEGIMIEKAYDCKRATAGFKSVVEDVEDTESVPTVNPKLIVKATLDEYIKIRKQLIGQGYPEVVADKVAREYLIGGK